MTKKNTSSEPISEKKQISKSKKSGSVSLNAKLKKMSINQFKSFGNRQEIPLKRINLIFGPNSSGKSSIIQSLLYLHTLENKPGRNKMIDVYTTLLGDGIVDLGGFGQYIYKRDLKNKLEFSFFLSGNTFDTEIVIYIYTDEKTKQLNTTFNVYIVDNSTNERQLVFETFGFKEQTQELSENNGISSKRIGANSRILASKELYVPFRIYPCKLLFEQSTMENVDFEKIQNHSLYAQIFHEEHKIMVQDTSIFLTTNQIVGYWVKFLRELVSEENDSKNIDDHEYTNINYVSMMMSYNALVALNISELAAFLNSLRYLGPIRPYPSRDFSEVSFNEPWSNRSKDVDIWGRLVDANSMQLQKINLWLGKLKTPYRLVPEKIFYELKIKLTNNFENDDAYLDMTLAQLVADNKNFNSIPRLLDIRTNTYVTHRDVGVGISQVLPVLIYAYSGKNNVICIEQPELHLHPRLQAELADIFIETSKKENNNHRYILETHSESLIERILTALYNGEISPDDISILYVDPVFTGNGSMVREIRVSEKGDLLDEWPDGFFDDARKERRKRY